VAPDWQAFAKAYLDPDPKALERRMRQNPLMNEILGPEDA
jgi:hypothetical protein